MRFHDLPFCRSFLLGGGGRFLLRILLFLFLLRFCSAVCPNIPSGQPSYRLRARPGLLVGDHLHDLIGPEEPSLPAQLLPGGLELTAGSVKEGPVPVGSSGKGLTLPKGEALDGEDAQISAVHLGDGLTLLTALTQPPCQIHHLPASMASMHTRSEGRKRNSIFCSLTWPIL